MKLWSTTLRGLTVFAVSIMVSFQVSADVVDPLDDEFYCQITEVLDRVTNVVREGRTHIDPSAFDLEAQLDRLDYNANNIIEFARRSIAFEQYPGSLRGPKGALLSLAGNALDQSLLLGALLRDAGIEARIARTTLDDETAVALLRQMRHPATGSVPGQISEQLADSLVKLTGDQITRVELLERLESSANPKTDPRFQKVEETTQFLRDALSTAGLETGRPGEGPELIAEASDYFWVQYRELAAGAWTDAHPAFVDDPPATMSRAATVFSGAVPEDLLHRIQLQFFIERKTGGKLEALPISGVWERPVANLVDTPVSFSVLPIGMTFDRMLVSGIAEAFDESAVFAPIFNGAVMPDGKFFDLKGNVVDPDAASSPAAGVVATVGDRFGNAVKALGGDVPTLTAHWIQITLIDPDGRKTSYRRTTLDRIGPAARVEGKAPDNLESTTPDDALELLRKHTIMIATGRTPVSLVVDRSFDWILRAEPMFRQLNEQVAYRAHDELAAPVFKPVDDLPTYWPGHLSLFSIFDRADALSDSHRIYRASPGVVIHVEGQRRVDTVFEMIDIVTNARRAVAIDKDIPRLDPEAAMIAGVWDTAKEGALLKPGDTRVDTETIFTNAIANGKRLITLPPGKPVSGMTLSPDIQALVESDLSRGFAVILPDGQELLESAAWWRVNPDTGETVGQAMDGRGATGEYMVIKGAIALSGMAFLYNADQCHKAYQRCNSLRRPYEECRNKYWCCNLFGVTTLVMGFFYIAHAVDSIMFDVGTTVGPTPCDLL
jgi:hypothetical protein